MQKKFINKNFLPTEYINDKVIKDSKDEKYGDFGCHTNDEKFLELEGNEAITIEGVFMKKGTGTGGMDYLSDCVLVNE